MARPASHTMQLQGVAPLRVYPAAAKGDVCAAPRTPPLPVLQGGVRWLDAPQALPTLLLPAPLPPLPSDEPSEYLSSIATVQPRQPTVPDQSWARDGH